LKIVTVDNIKKGLKHARRGSFLLIVRAVRHLWNRKRSFAPPTVKREYLPVVPIDDGKPIVTVVIPCFNYGRYVVEAIDSVLNQTLKDVEIIVVDGGSTDPATIDVLRKLDRPRTRVLVRTGRHLVGDNRNFGIDQALGRYVCCLDADDTISPTYLEKAIFLLEMYGYDAVSTAIRFVGAKSGTVGILPRPDLRSMVRGNHLVTCAVFRRTLWAASGGYFDFGLGREHVAEDWDFWIRLAALGARIRNLSDEPLFNYRIHQGGSLSSSSGVRSIADQGKNILDRNRSVLTRNAYRISAKQRQRRLCAISPKTALTHSMSTPDMAAGRLTLMLAIPFMLVGGAERLLSGVCGYLSRNGWRVIVVTTEPQDPMLGDSSDWFKEHTDEVYALPRFLETDEWQDFVEHLVISRRPDCLLTAGSQFFYDLLPVLTERYPRMAKVDLLFNTIGHVDSHLQNKEFYCFAMAENDDVLQWYLASGWDKNRIRKLTSGVDLTRYQPRPKPSQLLQKHNVSPTDFVVGFSGRLSPEKAPEVFVEIAKLCNGVSNVRFIMTGGGPMREDINKIMAQMPSGVRFDFVGIVDDVTPYLALYDVLVLPSRLDGRPLVVLEALACGLPVIASRVGGLPEMIVDDYNGYLCSPAVASEFAAHIQSLAADRQRLEKLKLAARAFAEQHLNIEDKLASYETSLRDAIKFQCMRPADTLVAAVVN
jgi:glycosyltransferase involved in cell wall biosynthesis